MRRGRVSLLLLALSAFGCSPDAPPPPPPQPPVEKPPPPEPPLPALGEVRVRDWSEVDDEPFRKLPQPGEGTGDLKWDFEAGRRYGYDFSETLSQRMLRDAGERHALNTSREKNRGVFEFSAGRDRTAVAISKIQTQEASLNDQPIARESFAKKAPSVSQCVVAEDGSAESKSEKGLADARMYFQSLFALQPGTRDLAPGKITTRHAGLFKVQRYECVRIESEFEIATDKPSEKLLLRGRVIAYFAVPERKFVRASAAVATSSRGNALTKEGVWITSSLDAVTHYRVKLLDSP